MMTTLTRTYMLLVAVSLTGLLTVCDNSDDPTSGTTVNLNLSSSLSGLAKPGDGRLEIDSSVELTDFQVSIREVKFEQEGDVTEEVEIAYEGPFAIDLLDETAPLEQALGDIDIEPGTYSRIRMKLHKTEDVARDHVLFDRSVYLAGTIDGVPFEMWHDTSENFDLESDEGFVIEADVANDLSLDFALEQIISGLDLSSAEDPNSDDLIEINPDDADESDVNRDLADELKDNIKLAADIIKE